MGPIQWTILTTLWHDDYTEQTYDKHMTNINTNGEMLKRQQCVLRKNVLLLIFEFSMYRLYRPCE